MCYLNGMTKRERGEGRSRERAPSGRAEYEVGIRELRQHASVWVDLAEKGHTVDITKRGRLAARLVPASEPESPLERLMAAGILRGQEDPGDPLDIEPLPPRPPGEETLTEMFLRTREEERW